MSAFPVLQRRATPDRTRAQMLLEEWGRTAFSRIAMGSGYRYALSADGRCVIPWMERGACALALGAPVGPEHRLEEAVAGFQTLSR